MRSMLIAFILGSIVAASALVGVTLSGCVAPPKGAVFIDIDGDGQPDGLAWDRDEDGKADLNAASQPTFVSGSEGYIMAEKVDAVAPGALTTIGGLLGTAGISGSIGAILVAVGAAWKGGRFARVFQNTVMSIQIARKRLKDSDNDDALALVDDALSTQLPATVKAVLKAKAAMNLKSVSQKDLASVIVGAVKERLAKEADPK